jgi:hypothetical protein
VLIWPFKDKGGSRIILLNVWILDFQFAQHLTGSG